MAVLVLVSACSSDDDSDAESGTPAVAPYQPADAATQPPLPPGAGPRPKTDSGTTPPPPMDAGQDVQPSDASDASMD